MLSALLLRVSVMLSSPRDFLFFSPRIPICKDMADLRRYMHVHFIWRSCNVNRGWRLLATIYLDLNSFPFSAITADVDPCPHNFRALVNGRCSEERLRFSQLDSVQALRETFPAAALTDDCPWSGAQTAAKFGLEIIQCVRSVQVR